MAIHVYFKCIFQIFYLDVCCKYFHLHVVKVDIDITYTCMLLFKWFQALHTSVASVLSRYMFAMVFK
jgi:hypothetical protein